ncbi:Cof-type HAD-IIB family hydrolase [Paenibacillus sp. LMG 31460]|uniref:Cof-type HAD-IIB family hydrolase n=1 Tax=Paenibacillus germinis TaxID=2654979 RepID=A0ABX1YYV0_9BACL|nr:Cof-type HAD-IIB family hydrolase [Paenibacillus germinis]NOU85739.1 Cof-type HAD-IIB family hydrolase [Paenibacillus germinis]
MKPKLIVLDLDGTLLNSKKQISKRNLFALQKVKAEGINIIFATARPPRAVKYEDINLFSFGTVVFYNGALFQCNVTDREIHYSISKGLVGSIFDYCLSVDPEANISVEVKDEWFTYKFLDYREMMKITTNPTIISKEILKTYDCTKILITDCNDSEHIIKKFGDQVNILSTDDGKLIQIMSVKSSKELAVKYLSESLGYKMSDVMCFGDDFNDLGLFQSCGISIAMGNAIKELKEIATEITETNDNDGVALILEKIPGISQMQANFELIPIHSAGHSANGNDS